MFTTDKQNTLIFKFFFRFALIRDGDVFKSFETRFPETMTEGKTIATEADFGQLRTAHQELEIKVTIAIYSYT